jgi:hypothetical protein
MLTTVEEYFRRLSRINSTPIFIGPNIYIHIEIEPSIINKTFTLGVKTTVMYCQQRPVTYISSLVTSIFNLNTVLILIRPCATQSNPAMFRCFFFVLYFITYFGHTGHHQVYKVCLRSFPCLFSYVLAAF